MRQPGSIPLLNILLLHVLTIMTLLCHTNGFMLLSSSSPSFSATPSTLSSSKRTTTTPRHYSFSFSSPRTTALQLVTEDDVLQAVETAETLWAQALEARKTANALSDRAEEEAEAAFVTAKDVEESFKDPNSPLSLEKIAYADKATKTNMDANSMVSKALEASLEADRLEKLAEEALQISEERLEQHLMDVPDSPLAQ
jgi:hypothetical protein